MPFFSGIISSFSNFSELAKIITVAVGLMGLGFSGGLLIHNYKGLPAVVDKNIESIEVNDSAVIEITAKQKDIALSLVDITASLERLNTKFNNMSWRFEIMACYQQETDIELRRECIEEARQNLTPEGETVVGGDDG